MNSVKTKKGTELPLLNLRGKAYLQVAHRLQWLNEDEDNFTIETQIVKADEKESVVRATVTILEKTTDGRQVVKKIVTATKREDTKGFADHLEKAETGAIGRALALAGYGTQFALSELDEITNSEGKVVERLADSPVTAVKATATVSSETTTEPKKVSTFRRTKTDTTVTNGSSATSGGWEN